jgi:hypothetical protein
MSGTEYKLNDFSDLLVLEDEQLDRFLSELPKLIAYAKAVDSLIGAVGDSMELKTKCEFLSPIVWIDDGKTDLSMRMVDENGDSQLEINITKD